jgi:hypothetical protein
LALPREATELRDVNDLAESLGKNSFIDLQRVSESAPKPSCEENRRAVRGRRPDRSLTVTRGRELLGHIEQHGQAFEAFDTDRRWLGHFATQAAAADAIERARDKARRSALPPGHNEMATGDAAGKSAVGDKR